VTLAVVASLLTSTAAFAQNATVRKVHAPDIATTIKPFLTTQGFLDPEFAAVVAAPSRYYSDFFGFQAIRDVPKTRILSDFVPKHGDVVSDDSASVTIQFKAGYTAQFFPQTTLEVMGSTAAVSHVRFSGDDWRTLRRNLTSFLSLLDSLELSEQYLLPNPGYADEVVVGRQLSGGAPAVVTADSMLSSFAQSSDGVLLIGERVHGRPEDLAIVRGVLESTKIDWLGLEMLDIANQPALDEYNRSKAGSAEHTQARAQLIAYFTNAWNGRAGPKTTGPENPYFQLVEAAHARGVNVIALEAASMPYLLFRYGEVDFGGAVRSYWWAKRAPAKGRGIIFGGSAHFNSPKPVNVQDFIVMLQPNRPVFSLKSIAKRAR
jgi:hypothetical protein